MLDELNWCTHYSPCSFASVSHAAGIQIFHVRCLVLSLVYAERAVHLAMQHSLAFCCEYENFIKSTEDGNIRKITAL